MDTGRKMEMSMVMTGLDLEINREVELSDHSEGSSQPKENKSTFGKPHNFKQTGKIRECFEL